MPFPDWRQVNRTLATFVALIYFGLTIFTATVKAQTTQGWRLGKWSPGYHNSINAIYMAFCGGYHYCARGDQAYRVALCEAGRKLSIWAHNGQYLGLFQMGSHERATFGYGRDPWSQARGARRYYDYAKGWGPWECQP